MRRFRDAYPGETGADSDPADPIVDPRGSRLGGTAWWSRHARAGAAIAFLIGLLAGVGWILDIAVLKSVFPGLVEMKANTAVALTIAGLALWTLHGNRRMERAHFGQAVAGAAVALVGALTFLEYIASWNLGIDELLFEDAPGAIGTTPPGRMVFVTTLCFMAVGGSILWLSLGRAKRVVAVQITLLTVFLISLFSLVGYFYGLEAFANSISYAPMALHTALAFIGLSVSGLLARPTSGLLQPITSEGTGGTEARRLLPTVFVVPLVLGGLRLAGQRAGWYPNTFGTTAFVVSVVVLLASVVWLSARRLNASDAERRAAEAEVERQNSLVTLLGVIGTAANESFNYGEAAQNTLSYICKYTGWPVGHAYFNLGGNTEKTGPTELWYFSDPLRYERLRQAARRTQVAPHGGLVGEVLATKELSWTPDIARLRDSEYLLSARDAGLQSAFVFPVMAGEEVAGVMEFLSDVRLERDEALIRAMNSIGAQLGRVVERERAETHLAYLADRDHLTGLANRRTFGDRLVTAIARAKRRKGRAGVLFLDLDDFKSVNDSYGHDIGDELLQIVAHRLTACVREVDTVARIGGDEFTMILETLAEEDECSIVARRIVDSLSMVYEIDGRSLFVTASVGIALYPDHGDGSETLLNAADAAMYDAKQQGANNFRFFEPAIPSSVAP